MAEQELNSQQDEINPEEMQRRAEELETILDIPTDEDGFIYCPVLPLRDVILFPHMVAPLPIGRSSTAKAIKQAMKEHQIMLSIPQKDPNQLKLKIDDFLKIGVTVAISESFSSDGQDMIILAQGRHRIEIVEFITDQPVLYARGKVIEESKKPNAEQDALMRRLMRRYERYAEMNDQLPAETLLYLYNIDDPGWLADMVTNSFSLRLDDRQKLLTLLNINERLALIEKLLLREIDVLEIEQELDARVHDDVERDNRENHLRERMRIIQGELGEEDPWARELKELKAKINDAALSEEVENAAIKELERLYQMPPMSPEVGVIRTYIDWILDLPWNDETEDNLNVTHAKSILNGNHFGLDKAKDRVLEYIAVKSLKPNKSRQPILCFVGPPGTGKTSLGRSIADALERKFVRLSLGGVRDEAEMRGHRRTYIGALPGRIIQIMKRAETINPLFVLDEIDKLGVGFRGDPAAALLEVLDPEQNNTFSDHYLEIPYDLSKVIFITTANSRDDIPWALLDRMEVIEFPGYIEEDKISIAKQFLVNRQVEYAGLDENEVTFSDQALQTIIRSYTFEAGVRNLEREIGRTCRKIARLKAEEKRFPTRITDTVIKRFLGPIQFFETDAEREDEVGVATSVAWTMGGGDIMPIEVLLFEGKGTLQITGQIGDVMQESAQAAMSYLKSRAKEFKIKPERFEETDVHVHVPEGAIPKDGPSAGITIATAIISAFTERKVRKDVCMTGEITLRGRVLPIGGLRYKVLAAHRSGLKTVIIPEKNKKDLVEVPKRAQNDLEIIPVSHMDEVLDIALLPKEKIARKSTTTSKQTSKKDKSSNRISATD